MASSSEIGFLWPTSRCSDSEKARCFSAARSEAIGPVASSAALQRYVRSWSTSRHGADIVNVRPQPRRASLIGSGPCSSSGSLAMLAAMRRASSRVSRCAAQMRLLRLGQLRLDHAPSLL